MTPKSTIALEAAGSGPGRPGPQLPGPCEGVAGDDRLAALFAAAEARLGESGRVLLRPSGTEPLVRVMAEAETQQQADEVCERLAKVVADELAL